jgi:hypothetical protein
MVSRIFRRGQAVTGRGIPRKPATPEQIAELRALGYTKLSLVYSPEEAERILSRLRAEKAAQEAKQAPALVTAWQKGESLLDAQGYSVHEMPGTHGVCYEVHGGAEVYHVCIGSKEAAYGCTCPDGAWHGDKRPCKHFLGVCVQLWRWAQESAQDCTEWLEQYGIMALYRAGHRETSGEPATLALFGEEDGQESGGGSAVGVL